MSKHNKVWNRNRTFKDSQGTVYTIMTDNNGKPVGVSVGDSTRAKAKDVKSAKIGARLHGGKMSKTKDKYHTGNGKYVSYARAKQLKII